MTGICMSAMGLLWLPSLATRPGSLRALLLCPISPPITTTALAQAYYQRILDALPTDSDFQPLMTLYLTDDTLPGEISRAKNSGVVFAIKLYPAGATTNSDSGVTQLQKTWSALAAMETYGLPLLVHGGITGSGSRCI